MKAVICSAVGTHRLTDTDDRDVHVCTHHLIIKGVLPHATGITSGHCIHLLLPEHLLKGARHVWPCPSAYCPQSS